MKDFLRRPISSSELDELLHRLLRSPRGPVAQFGKVVGFMSNKGGVGKSTLAVNTAVALAVRHPGRVLLVDASVQMGVCASMLDLQPTASIADAVRQRHRLDETLIRQLATPHAGGLHLLAAPADPLEAGDLDDDVISRIYARPPRLQLRAGRHFPPARPDQRGGDGPLRPGNAGF